jgi:hypothetical protein
MIMVYSYKKIYQELTQKLTSFQWVHYVSCNSMIDFDSQRTIFMILDGMIYDVDLKIIELLTHGIGGMTLRQVFHKMNWSRVHRYLPISVILDDCQYVNLVVRLSSESRTDFRAHVTYKNRIANIRYWVDADYPKLKIIIADDLRRKIFDPLRGDKIRSS